jgi:ABC-type branched-subunit amino acid transport system substrate-binding protein
MLVLAGCPTRFDPRAETVKGSPNAEADHLYREARARLDIGDLREARTRFADFLERYPNDPLAPSARLGEARAALGLGEAQKAKELIEPMVAPTAPADDPQAARARYLLGLALHKTGDWERSRELLRPFVHEVAGDDAIELHAVIGDDAAKLNDPDEALREYSLFFAGARPAEKLYLRDRAADLVTKLPSNQALQLWNALPKDSLAAAYLGRRVAADRRAAGDETTAKQILDESRGAREKAGLEEGKAPASKDQSVRAVGCLLPLGGKSRALGERALRGALLAADLMSDHLPSGLPIELRVRDTESDPVRAAAAAEELAGEGVVAILGPPDRVESQLAVPRAESLGVPFLELAPDDVRRGSLIFKLVRSRGAAATGLVQKAQKSGARTVAILAPDSAYGRSMAQSLADAAKAAGLRVVADVRYPETNTTFIDPVKKLQAAAPDALLVPAPASQLALIAPQLSSSGLVRVPGVKPTGKLATLYATADGITDKFLAGTAKYLQGAVLAPTFYPDPAEPRMAAFIERYRAAYNNEEPTSLDALAFDAVRAARVALDHEGGAANRSALAQQLLRVGENGLTGELGFNAAGERAGNPPLYIVDGDTVRALK